MGAIISRKQQVRTIINNMIECCASWAHIGRTLGGRVVVVQAIILSTIWDVLSAIPVSPIETEHVQRIVGPFTFWPEEITWNMPTKRTNLQKRWLNTPKNQEGLTWRGSLTNSKYENQVIYDNFPNKNRRGTTMIGMLYPSTLGKMRYRREHCSVETPSFISRTMATNDTIVEMRVERVVATALKNVTIKVCHYEP